MGPTATEGVLRDLSKDTFSKARVLSAFIGSMGLQGPQTQKEVLQSITCRNAGDYSGALAAADEALTVNPTSAEARHQRILALTYLGKHAVAMTEAITLAADEPSKPRLQLSVGLMLVQRGRTAEARPYLERGVEGCPVDPEGLSALGRILIGTGEYDRAEELLRAAHAINAQRAPDVPSLLETIATLRAEASESPPK